VSNHYKKRAVLSILLSIPILVVVLAGSDFGFYYRLLQYGIATFGKVTAKEPDNHATVRYSFDVDSKTYFGGGSAGFGTSSFDELKVGDDVLVVYMPNNPSVSCLGHPKALLKDDLTFVGLATVFVPIAMWFSLGRWERRRINRSVVS